MVLKKTMPFFLSTVLLLGLLVVVFSNHEVRSQPIASFTLQNEISFPQSPMRAAEVGSLSSHPTFRTALPAWFDSLDAERGSATLRKT